MKKKNLAVLAIFFTTSGFAQPGASTSYSLTMDNIESGTKNKIGQCVNIYYYFPEGKALGLQYRNSELWKYGPEPNSFVQLKTANIQAFLFEDYKTKNKIIFSHQVGISAGVGTTVYKENPDLKLLKIGLFSGIFIEIGTGTRISEKLILIFSIKSEGIYGLIRDDSGGGQVGGANGFISFTIKVKYDKNTAKNKISFNSKQKAPPYLWASFFYMYKGILAIYSE